VLSARACRTSWSTIHEARVTKFNAKFPDGIELLVRGLRSGLPVAETLGVVAQEVPGPVGEEFKRVVERMKIGRTMEESLQVTADQLGTPSSSSSSSRWRSSARPAATSPRRCRTSPTCCASARR
jgi:Flp pilus assembly protein TadB